MFKVLHSSAGAGKTHALVKHYLGHCLGTSDHGAYRHVLALTFTNKAAAEMKERVIGYLEGLARGGPYTGPLGDVADALCATNGIDHAALAHRSGVVLQHMLHHWGDVAISTIDAFTRRVVKPFARDLRMDQDLRMTTEQDHYRTEAVNRLIDRAGSDERITDLLTRTCLQLLHEERPWEPTTPLLDLSRELLNERSIGPLLRSRGFTLEQMGTLMERLNADTARFRRQVNELGRTAVALCEGVTRERGDIAHGGALVSHFRKLAAFTDHWDAPGPHSLKPIETGKFHAGKTDPATVLALNGIVDRVTLLFHESERLRIDQLPRYTVQRAVARELLPAFALHELDAGLETLKQEDAVAFFSDLTRRVAEVVKHEPVPFIYERLGERYRHFLIDEFQDTSVLQWNALLPLLDHALSTAGSVLLVGDAKQAIYRWRNGEVRLFVRLPYLFGLDPDDDAQVQREATLRRTYTKGEPLAHNRRSAQRIINFNNALFAALAPLLPDDLRTVYADHAQQRSRPDQGTVNVELADAGLRGHEQQQAVDAFALRNLQSALTRGHAPGDVAILVRSKRVGRAVAEHLLAHGHAVISPDGLQLAADPAVQLLVDCLRYLVHADETTAARILQWHAMLRDAADDTATPVQWAVPPQANGRLNTAAAVDAWLAEHGDPALHTSIAALVEDLARRFGLQPASDNALLTLLDEIHGWTTGHAQDIAGFLEHWDRSGGQRSNAAADGAHAVQVMTVHKSKGLQFPVVIVPDACMANKGRHNELLWVAPGAAVPELDTALVRESKALRTAELPELVEEDGLRTLDTLNLLYVAFTRAELELHAFVPSASDAVTKGLAAFAKAHPELARSENGPIQRAERSVAQPAVVLHDVATPDVGHPWTLRAAGSATEDPEQQRERRYGTTVHAILAATATAADFPAATADAVSRGDLTADEAVALGQHVLPTISAGPVARWFAQGADVRSEAAIITGDGQSLRPDRVVVNTEGTCVLEIKTGKPTPAHTEQLGKYLGILREMGHATVRGTIWYVASGELRDVP